MKTLSILFAIFVTAGIALADPLLTPKQSSATPPKDFYPFTPANHMANDIGFGLSVSDITSNSVQQTALDNAINALGLTITNYSLDAYATWAPQAPKGSSKIGGGLMALYDFNQNAGAGIGLDWLGQFSLVSGDLQLKAPFHLSTITGALFSGVPAINTAVIIPFALGGVGTPYSGNGRFNGSAMVISDLGGAIEFGHLWGGQFDAGVAWGKWVGKGPYGNVTRYHLFLGYSKGI